MAFFDNDKVIDFTPMIELVDTPNTLISSMNIFDTYRHATTLQEIVRTTSGDALIPARERGGERNWMTQTGYDVRPVRIPFFPLDHNIKAADVQDFRAFLSTTDTVLESTQSVVSRYVETAMRNAAYTKEAILANALMGRQYVGVDRDGFSNENFNYDYYTLWGVTQETADVDFTSTTIDPTDVIEEEVRAYMIDTIKDGSSVTDMVVVCGRSFFSKLITSPYIRTIYAAAVAAGRNPNLLFDRVGGSLNARTFEFRNVTYVEDIHGNVPTSEAYAFPRGVANMFQAHYAPADHYSYVNQIGQDYYQFLIQDEANRVLRLQTEFSLLGMNTRPELVVKLSDANP